MDRYPDHLKNARKKALRHVNSTNLADTKGHGPKGLKPEVWNGLVDIWLKPEWTKMSDANRCNRAAKPDSALHTGGSISFREHKKRMVNIYNIFIYNYTLCIIFWALTLYSTKKMYYILIPINALIIGGRDKARSFL
jgi:hypothetical protein